MKTLLLILLSLFASSFSYAAPISEQQVLPYLVRYEGMKSRPYRDANQWCVGVGHVLRGTVTVKKTYSREEILAFFHSDFLNAQRICRKGVKDFDFLPSDAQLISIGLAFSCGPTGFMLFHDYRLFLSHRRYRGAADSLKLSIWWNQVSAKRAQENYDVLAKLSSP